MFRCARMFWRMLTRMEKSISLIGSFVTAGTSERTVYFFMTSDTKLMVGTFQARLILVKYFTTFTNNLAAFRRIGIGKMTATTSNYLGNGFFFMAKNTISCTCTWCSNCVMMAFGAIIFSKFNM